jgi:hypothetical protein
MAALTIRVSRKTGAFISILALGRKSPPRTGLLTDPVAAVSLWADRSSRTLAVMLNSGMEELKEIGIPVTLT